MQLGIDLEEQNSEQATNMTNMTITHQFKSNIPFKACMFSVLDLHMKM